MATSISRPAPALSIASTSSSPVLSILSTDVLLPHHSTPALPLMDSTNTLTPRSRALLVKQAQKLQRILGETPHIELAIDLVPPSPTRPSAAVLAKRRNTVTVPLPLPLPSPPLTSSNGHTLALKPSMPTITLTSVPRPPSPPPSPSSMSFSSPILFSPQDDDSDCEVDPEMVERRRIRARLAKIKRWTGENVPISLVAPGRRSADERRNPREVVHARSKSVLIPASTVTTSEKGEGLLSVEAISNLLSQDAAPVPSPISEPAAKNAGRSSRRCSEESEGGKEIRRTAKLSKFFGVPATQLPPPPPSVDVLFDKHARIVTEPVPELEPHLARARSVSSQSAGHSHTMSMSSASQVMRTMTPFSEYSYDSDDSDKGVEIRVRRGKGRTPRLGKKDSLQGRIGEMEREDFAMVMDKLRRMK